MSAPVRGRVAARIMLVADFVVLALLGPAFLLGGGLGVSLFAVSTTQLAAVLVVALVTSGVAAIAAIVYLVSRRGARGDREAQPRAPGTFGEGRWLRGIAWATILLNGFWVVAGVVEVVQMMLYYDGKW